MGIARALRRVKRQAKRGGLGAIRSGLSEELRSGAIPGPLRRAARKIAALLDPQAGHHRKPGSTATPPPAAPVETLRRPPPEQANKLGSDRGDAPVEPTPPADDDEVDPISVGATPVYDATPTQVELVDATPEVVANDVTPLVIDELPASPVNDEPPKPKSKAKPETKAEAKTESKPKAKPAAKKVAPAAGDAKSVARKTPKPKGSGGSGGKASKKK